MRLTVFLILIYSCSSIAKKSSTQLVQDANTLCGEIARHGYTENFELKGEAKLELANILKKLGASAGIKGSGEVVLKKFSGVFQEDLAKAIDDGNNCKLSALNMLKEYEIEMEKMKSEISRDERISGQLKSCLNGNVIECEGIRYKFQEANTKCMSEIRGEDRAKDSFAKNQCAAKYGGYFQITALVNKIYQHCRSRDSDPCKNAIKNSRYHSNDDLTDIAIFLAKNT
ncbi:MAG: hypothetical protein ACRBCI_07180 [Cellvibrionaceae bacterium]